MGKGSAGGQGMVLIRTPPLFLEMSRCIARSSHGFVILCAAFPEDAGVDEGPIAYKGCGPAPLAHNAYGRDEIHYLQVRRG